MEGNLLTVEETVEVAPVSTPTPRRRSPRPRAAAKPDAQSPENADAVPEAVVALETPLDRPPAPPEIPSEFREETSETPHEAVASAEPEVAASADPTPETPTVEAAAAEAPVVAAPVWESPPIDRPAEPTGDGRAEL